MAAVPLPVQIGDVYGRLTVIRKAPDGPGGHKRSVCRCSCGAEATVTNSRLVSGHTRSCGCLARDAKPTLKHGESHTRLYSIWKSMKFRCNNPDSPAYKWYGARGIRVHRAWNRSYEEFAKWAKDNGYHDELTLDRIDVDKGYEPGNCRFIPLADQQRNRRNNRLVTFNGETHCVEQWARIVHINSGTLSTRLNRYHWSPKYALTVPAGTAGRHGRQRPYDIYGRHPVIERMFDGCTSYPELAERMAAYIEGLIK